MGVTNRYARTAVYRSISNLAPTASATYTLETSELSGVNWDKLHFVVLVDYRPAGSSGAYDMLQAATALPLAAPFAVYPETLVFFVDPTDPSIVSAQMSLQGASFVNWTSNSSTPWFFSDPTNGPLTTQPAISVIKDSLSPGWQEGIITYTTTDGYFSDQAVIKSLSRPSHSNIFTNCWSVVTHTCDIVEKNIGNMNVKSLSSGLGCRRGVSIDFSAFDESAVYLILICLFPVSLVGCSTKAPTEAT